MDHKGFTLLELLLSLTIMALITALCFSAFHTGIRSWEKGDKKVVENQRLRIVADLLKRQLASYTRKQIFQQGNGQYLYFNGSEKSIEFLSRISLYPGDGGIFYVRYRIIPAADNKESLGFYEHDVMTLHGVNLNKLANADFQPLASDYNSVSFAFLADETDKQNEPVWLTEWDQAAHGDAPRAVRITMADNPHDPPLEIVVPLSAGRGI